LLFDERRSATVTAISRIKLMRLDKESFRVLLSDLHAELLLRVPRDERWKKTEPSPHRAAAWVQAGGGARDGARGEVHRRLHVTSPRLHPNMR
jgi:hypothetical protein